ncbi:MAG TPA: nicotinate phosphoribosyltransferase [Limnochordales bacterium]
MTLPGQRPLELLRDEEGVGRLRPDPARPLFSATHEEVLLGHTTDVYFVKTQQVLRRVGKADTLVVAEVFPRGEGLLAGVEEALRLLANRPPELGPVEVWALDEGEPFAAREVVLRIHGPYSAFGIYETAILGILAHSSGWATAARRIVEAAGGKPVSSFGARHVHPAVAPVMERAALIGGAAGAACVLGAKLLGREPVGTVPHALMLILGDTVEGALAYHRHAGPGSPRIILVDTFKDEAEESLRVAQALGEALEGIRLDTPGERGGVTPELVREVRARLDQAGYRHVRIFVSGGLTPEKVRALAEAGADAFGVGSYISSAAPIDMTMDIKEVAGRPVAKRGRIPGITPNPRLRRRLPGGDG